MKTPGKKTTSVVAGAVLTGLTLGSCQGYFIDEDDYSLEAFKEYDSVAIPISFAPEEVEYLNFLDKLGKDIIEQPIIAKEFAKSPKLFLERYGYSGDIDLEEGMLKLIIALGDDDINAAIKNKDVSSMLALFDRKGLLNAEYIKLKVTDEIRQQALSVLNLDNETIQDGQAWIVPVLVLAVLVAAALFGVAVSLVTYAGVATSVETYGKIQKSQKDLFIENNPVFKIWKLKGEEKDSYIAVDNCIEKIATEAISYTKKNNPELLNNISDEEFKNVLKLNILKQ